MLSKTVGKVLSKYAEERQCLSTSLSENTKVVFFVSKHQYFSGSYSVNVFSDITPIFLSPWISDTRSKQENKNRTQANFRNAAFLTTQIILPDAVD